MTAEITILRVFLYVGMWTIVYEFSIPAFEAFLMLTDSSYFGPNGIQEKLKQVKIGGKTRRCNLKRLIRSEIYCLFATISGAYMLYNHYRHWPMDLIHHWSDGNAVLFEIAAGHWILTIFEDAAAGRHIISHINADIDEMNSLYLYYKNNLFAHHVITIFAYGYSLYSHKLSALCVFGLLFEAPVLILTYRDICVCFAEELLYPIRQMDEKSLKVMWGTMYVLWHVCRSGACLLYPFSLIFWRSQLVTLSLPPRVIYHILGCLFCYVNAVLLLKEIPRLVEDDYAANGLVSDDAHRALRSSQRRKREQQGAEDIDGDMEAGKPLNDSKKTTELRTSGVDSMGKMLLGPKELSKHHSVDDLWISIEGHVYDITKFQKVHPGGAQVLLQCAGADASKEFLDAGHSQQARQKMKRFHVGQMLGHGYDQLGDVALDESMLGDLSAPYQLGRVYTTRADPFADSWVVYAVSLIFMAAIVKDVLTHEHHGGSRASGGSLTARDMFNGGLSAAVEPAALLLLCVSLWCGLLKILATWKKGQVELVATWTILGYPFSFNALFWSILDWRMHVNGLLILGYVSSLWTVLSVDVMGHNHALRCIRASLVVSFAGELIYRKVIVPPRHADIAIPYKDFVLNMGYMFAPCALLVMAALLDTFTVSVHSATALARAQSALHLTESGSSGKNGAVVVDAGDGSGVSEDLSEIDTGNVLSQAVVIMSAIFFASLMRSIMHRQMQVVSSTPSSTIPNRPPLDIFSSVLGSTFLGFVYGCILHSLVLSSSTIASFSALSLLLSMDINILILWGFTAFVLSYSLLNSGVMVQWSTCHFTVQTKALGAMALLWILAPPVGIGKYVVFCLFVASLWFVSDEAHRTLDVLGSKGECPKWIYAAKQIENVIRHMIALSIHFCVSQVTIAISSTIAPRGQKYWTYPQPVMDLGPNCDYGMAYQINGSPQKKPGIFQCNVGYIGDDVTDYIHTAGSTREMMEGLLNDKDAGDNGFVTDVVAHFMLTKKSAAKRDGHYFIREINFNVWESDEAAMKWYRNSKVHKELVKKYYGGGLSGFSAMLASLKPTEERPIRWDVRCRNCRYMVQGPNPESCPHCGAKIRPMPYF